MGDLFENPMGTDGFEFVEYTAPDPVQLRALFARMGFPIAARHRSKNVTLHRQGDINFIINAEPQGFGQQFAHTHGPSACAMAFRVRDAAFAFRRAVELGDGWQPELGLQEMERAAHRFHAVAAAGGRVPPPLLALGRRLGLTQDTLGPEREPVHGSPEQVASDLQRYQRLGVRHFVFGIYRPSVEEIVRDMELFATRVKPLIASGS